MSEGRWLRLWFSFRDPVDRRTDLPHGVQSECTTIQEEGGEAPSLRHEVRIDTDFRFDMKLRSGGTKANSHSGRAGCLSGEPM